MKTEEIADGNNESTLPAGLSLVGDNLYKQLY